MAEKRLSRPGRSKTPRASPNSGRLYSREVIANHFLRTGDLTTVHLTATILYKTGDLDRGATLFIERFRYLLDHVPAGRTPTLIWLVRELDQLRHVVNATRECDRELFNRLTSQAIYCEARSSTPFYADFDLDPMKAVGTTHPTLTVKLRTDAGGHRRYSYFSHFSPEDTGEGWDKGPYCQALPSVPKRLPRLLSTMRQAHAELIGSSRFNSNRAVKLLEKADIFAAPLAEILSSR